MSAATDHPTDSILIALTLGGLATAESLRVQLHLFNCGKCLQRLIAAEFMLALYDADHGGPPRVAHNPRKPLSIQHDTADGFIYCQVSRRGRKWLARHWGEQLDGITEFSTMREANEHALKSFNQMFPEHRCTSRCGPAIEESR